MDIICFLYFRKREERLSVRRGYDRFYNRYDRGICHDRYDRYRNYG